jgi:hypothetical protein
MALTAAWKAFTATRFTALEEPTSLHITLHNIRMNPDLIAHPSCKQDYWECRTALSCDGLLLEHIHVQTQEWCNLAVRQNALALAFVEERFRTEDLCLRAVCQNPYAAHCIPQYAITWPIALAIQERSPHVWESLYQ